MPRNPNKGRCQIPRCKAWAMRDHTHCRPHRDLELGPRGAGAPKGNLNALKTAANAHFLPEPELKQLGYEIAQDADFLKKYLIQLLEEVDRCADTPIKTLLLYTRLLQQLTPVVSNNLFMVELKDYLQRLPPSRRSAFQTTIWKHAILRDPMSRLDFLRGVVNRLESVN